MTAERTRRAAGLLAFVAFGIGVAIYLLARVGTTLLPGAKQYRFEADVKSSIALANAADVREAGVRIGRVTGIKQAGSITALDLSVDNKYGPVYKNSTVLIRSKSVAGENYVELNQGDPSSGTLRSGGVLPLSQELQPTQDDDVFSIFNAPERKNLARGLSGLGSGLSGQGANNLNQTIEASTAVVNQGQDFAQVLADERNQVSQLVSSFDTVTAALGNRAQDIQTLTRSALTTASAVATRDAALRATIDALPGFLAQGRQTAQRLGSFSVNATPVMYNLRLAAQALVPAVRDLGPASREATKTLSTLAEFAQVAQPTFKALTPFATATRSFVSPYSGFLQQLNPFVSYIDPYWRELSTWFANTGAAVEPADSIGHLARIVLPISRSNFPTIVQGPAAAILKALSGGLDTRGTDSYPPAGTSGTPEPLPATVPPLSADPPYLAKTKPKR
jgi:phospholipid/cholesterol/gamma-HCH transport system substrate-binding protein